MNLTALGTSHKGNHSLLVFLGPVYFTQHMSSRHPCCSMYPNVLLVKGWTVFHYSILVCTCHIWLTHSSLEGPVVCYLLATVKAAAMYTSVIPLPFLHLAWFFLQIWSRMQRNCIDVITLFWTTLRSDWIYSMTTVVGWSHVIAANIMSELWLSAFVANEGSRKWTINKKCSLISIDILMSR